MSDLAPVPHDGSHLTNKQADTIITYIKRCQTILHLDHWRIRIARDLPPEHAIAMIEPTDGRRFALIYLQRDWWDRTPADKRTDIAHELLHLLHHDTDEHIRRFLSESDDISPAVTDLTLTQFRTNLERMVDHLSYVVDQLLPPWPTKPGRQPKKHKQSR